MTGASKSERVNPLSPKKLQDPLRQKGAYAGPSSKDLPDMPRMIEDLKLLRDQTEVFHC